VVSVEDVLRLQGLAERGRGHESVLDYVMRLVAATRTSPMLTLGVSPRGSLALLRAARAHALADGRDFLVPDDVKRLAVPALAHRVLVRARTAATADGVRADTSLSDADQVIRAIVQEIAVPR